MQKHVGEENKQGKLLAQLVQDMLKFFFPKKETKINTEQSHDQNFAIGRQVDFFYSILMPIKLILNFTKLKEKSSHVNGTIQS